MATANFFGSSFSAPLWQDTVDFINPALIEIPLGTLSPTQNGFAFENFDGTYTVFLGDVDFNVQFPVIGEVTEILRMSDIDGPPTADNTLAEVSGNFLANLAYDHYLDGGDDFFKFVFGGNDAVDIDSPSSIGPLDRSPVLYTYDGDDVVFGSVYHDEIHGGRGSDRIQGGDGSDLLYGDLGNDELNGGDGNDTLYGKRGDDDLNGDDGFDSLRGGHGNDLLQGGAGNDFLRGGRGADTLLGQNGNDFLFGSGGNDSLSGGTGNDTIRGHRGVDTIHGGSGHDNIYGGRDGDFLYGENGDDVIYGRTGFDFIFGAAGQDTIRGGNGDDTIYPGLDDDVVYGGAGNLDTVVYNRDFEAYDVDVNNNGSVEVTDLVGDGGHDLLMGIERVIFDDGAISV